MILNNKQKQYLKGLAHNLKPVVLLGQHGLTEGVLVEIDLALSHHELIKVKVASENREMKQLVMDAIVRETGAVKVQSLGHILTIYRAANIPKIQIPRK
ncbi:ribosome assembly RNA-binding protein YhbY [Aeromonas cavernicola]|uniref:Ribosome assembly RNA-binding protein YhbY n=1 Tax=Aeromonas cavernicola TaxID=1006623 RepID=A0A2H9U4U3_9GAMM|nr:ribosome assembly RNA-binding protein YhbY [Aeromonas cavernicola]PJG59070.1 ribosome assembly RNA-binding protein YhbY [Aeromonas cavernicola]